MSHVYFARVLPFDGRVAWFASRGMPQADQIAALAQSTRSAPGPAVVGIAEDDPAFAPWWRWFDREGAATWRRYVATHPWYLVTEPLQEPERVYNNAEGSIAFYRPAGLDRLPLTTSLLWPSTATTLVGLAAVAHVARRRRLAPLVAVAAAGTVAAATYAIVAWHSDAMESARHVFVAGATVRLALLLASVGLLDDRSRAVTRGRPPDTEHPESERRSSER